MVHSNFSHEVGWFTMHTTWGNFIVITFACQHVARCCWNVHEYHTHVFTGSCIFCSYHTLWKALGLFPHLQLISVVLSCREQCERRLPAAPQSHHHHSPWIRTLRRRGEIRMWKLRWFILGKSSIKLMWDNLVIIHLWLYRTTTSYCHMHQSGGEGKGGCIQM